MTRMWSDSKICKVFFSIKVCALGSLHIQKCRLSSSNTPRELCDDLTVTSGLGCEACVWRSLERQPEPIPRRLRTQPRAERKERRFSWDNVADSSAAREHSCFRVASARDPYPQLMPKGISSRAKTCVHVCSSRQTLQSRHCSSLQLPGRQWNQLQKEGFSRDSYVGAEHTMAGQGVLSRISNEHALAFSSASSPGRSGATQETPRRGVRGFYLRPVFLCLAFPSGDCSFTASGLADVPPPPSSMGCVAGKFLK